MTLRYFIALVVFHLAAGWAHASCLFARDVQPQHWYEWANALFSGEVTNIEQDSTSAIDIVTVRVVETFKGPKGESATVRIPNRMWNTCRLDRPVAGAQVLVAMNPNNDTALIPLTANYIELLRQHRDR